MTADTTQSDTFPTNRKEPQQASLATGAALGLLVGLHGGKMQHEGGSQ